MAASIRRLSSVIITGFIGVFGVVAGIIIERLVQRYGKLRFVADEVAIFVEGEEIAPSTERGYIARAVYSLPIDPDLLEAVERLEFSVRVQFFNEKEVRTGLRDVAIIFRSSNRDDAPQVVAPVAPIMRESGTGPEMHRLDAINLASREWLSLEIGGSFHDSTAQEQILAFSEITHAEFRGYFPDGREFRHHLKVRGEPPS